MEKLFSPTPAVRRDRSRCLVAAAGCVVEALERRCLLSAQVDFLSLTDVNDIAFDPQRDILFASTSTAIVRYDVAAESWLAPLDSSGLPAAARNGIDLAPDGSALWVAADDASGGANHVWRFALDAAGERTDWERYAFTPGGKEGFAQDIITLANGRALFTTDFTGNGGNDRTPLHLADIASGTTAIVSGAPSTGNDAVRDGTRLARNLDGTYALVSEAGSEGRIFVVDATAAGTLSFPSSYSLNTPAGDGPAGVAGYGHRYLVPRADGQGQVFDNNLLFQGTVARADYAAGDLDNLGLILMVDAEADTAGLLYPSDLTFPEGPIPLGQDVPLADGAPFDGGEATLGHGGRLAFITTADGIIKLDFGAPFTVHSGGPYVAQEGTTVELSASVSGSMAQVTGYNWDFDYDGQTFDVDSTGQTTTLAAPDGPLTRTIGVRAFDRYGRTVVTTTTLEVQNLPPEITPGRIRTDEGLTVTLPLAASDPGDDTITQWIVDWGDGTTDTLPGTATQAQHLYADGPAAHALSMTAVDEDGRWTLTGDVQPALDTSFAGGTGGPTMSTIDGATSSKPLLVRLADGGLLVGGRDAVGGTDRDWTLFRFDADGLPVTTFGVEGSVTVSVPDSTTSTFPGRLDAITELPDGRLLLAGRTRINRPVLVMLNPDGTPDPVFGERRLDDLLEAMKVVASPITSGPHAGKILAVVGQAAEGSVTLVRFNADGSLDLSFGTAGDGRVPVEHPEGREYFGDALFSDDGSLLLGGWAEGGIKTYLARFDGEGRLEPDFGTGGFAHFDFWHGRPGDNDFSYVDSIKVDEAGRIWVGGRISFSSGTYYAAAARLEASGQLDPTFGEQRDGNVRLVPMSRVLGNVELLLRPPGQDGALLAGSFFLTDNDSSYAGLVGFNDTGVDKGFGQDGLLPLPPVDGALPSLLFGTLLGEVPQDDALGLPPLLFVGGSETDLQLRRMRLAPVAPFALVRDVPPTISVTHDSEVGHGEPLAISFSATDPGDDTVESWRIDWGDGQVLTLAGDATTSSHVYADPGEYDILVSLTNEDGFFMGEPVSVTVVPTPPVAVITAPDTALEGTTLPLSGTASTGTIETWEWDLDYDGVTFDVDRTSPSPVLNDLDGPSTRTVALRVTGPLGVDLATHQLTVENVAPTVTLSGTGVVDEGKLLTIDWTAYDPGDDTITQWQFEWGDGTTDTFTGDARTASHLYGEAPARHRLRILATDEDGTHDVAFAPWQNADAPDRAFGNIDGWGGFGQYEGGSNDRLGTAVVVLPDGSIVLAADGGLESFLLKLDPYGNPDPSFGFGGKVSPALEGRWGPHFGMDILPLPDGGFLVAGHGKGSATPEEIVFFKLDAFGRFDSGFGDAAVVGMPRVQESGPGWFALDVGGPVVVQDLRLVRAPDGGVALMVGGASAILGNETRPHGQVIRLTPDLIPDLSYGVDAVFTVPGPAFDENIQYEFFAAAFDGAGRLVLSGERHAFVAGNNSASLLIRVTPDGQLDTTFGTDGLFLLDRYTTSVDERAGAVAVLADGKILTGSVGALFRLDGDGTLDESFGTGGVLLDPNLNTIRDLRQRPGGGFLALGARNRLVGLTADGQLDSAYGNGGILILSQPWTLGPTFDRLALAPDGAPVIAGSTWSSYPTPSYLTAIKLASSDADVVLRNLPPEPDVEFPGPYVPLDLPTTLAFSATDPGGDAISRWHIDWGDGTTQVLDGTATEATHVYEEVRFSLTIRVSAIDDDGAAGTVTHKVQVISAPVADAGGNRVAFEGTPVNLSGYGGIASTYEWDFDYDGVSFDVDAAGQKVSLPAPDGPLTRTVALRATNIAGSDIDTFILHIANRPPEITANLPAEPSNEGEEVDISFSATDPGLDTISGWQIDWGDGTIDDLPGDATSASHIFADDGVYPIRIRAIDEDGRWSAPLADPDPNTQFGINGSLDVTPDSTLLYRDAASGDLFTAIGSDGTIILSRIDATGAPVASWGTDGTVTLPLPPDTDGLAPAGLVEPYAMTIASDGSLLLGGMRTLISDGRSVMADIVMKLTAEGQIDPSFGDGGLAKTITYSYLARSQPRGVVELAIDGSGRILAASENGFNFGLSRLLPDGTLDQTFGGGNGSVMFSVPGRPIPNILHRRTYGGMVLEADRIFIAIGAMDSVDGQYLASANLIGFNAADGGKDADFGVGGIVQVDLPGPGGYSELRDLRVDEAGRFVLGGRTADPYGADHLFLTRILPDGSVDAGFGFEGTALSPALGGVATVDSRTLLHAMEDGSWLLIGTRIRSDVLVAVRFTPDGQLDPALDGDGFYEQALPGTTYAAIRAGEGWGDHVLLLVQDEATGDTSLRAFTGFNTAPLHEVNDLPGRIDATGAAEAFEGSPYEIHLSASDPGDDPITAWTVDWGDGTRETLPGDTTVAAHVFADGPSLTGIGIRAVNDDGHLLSTTLYPVIDSNDAFGDDGVVKWSISLYDAVAHVALLDDGSTLSFVWDTFPRLRVYRHLPDGSPDTSYGADAFGIDNWAYLPGTNAPRTAYATLPGGRAVASSRVNLNGDPSSIAVSVLDADGYPDETFGTGGLAYVPAPWQSSDVTHITPLPDGGLLVGGESQVPIDGGYDQRVFFFRLLPDGAVDHAFGAPDVNGVTMVQVPDAIDNGRPVDLADIMIDAAGRPLMMFHVAPVDSGPSTAILRLTPQGQADTTFSGGWIRFGLDGDHHDIGHTLATLSDGSILVGGFRNDATGLPLRPVVLKLLPGGLIDSDFGTDGRALLRENVSGDAPGTTFGGLGSTRVEAGDADEIYVLIPAHNGEQGVDALHRLTAGGAIDTAFQPLPFSDSGNVTPASGWRPGTTVLQTFLDGWDSTYGKFTRFAVNGDRLLFGGRIASDLGADHVILTLRSGPGLPIRNVAPTFEFDGPSEAAVGVETSLDLYVSDPGLEYQSGYRLDWGDGTVETVDLPPGDAVTGRRFLGTAAHTYAAAGEFDVVLTLIDDDGQWQSQAFTITVTTQKPTADAGGDRTLDEGGSYTLVGNAMGVVETWEWDLDYDGTFTPDSVGREFTFAVGDGPATRLVALRVTGPGGSSIDVAELTIVNAAPVLHDLQVTYPMAGRVAVRGLVQDSQSDLEAGFSEAVIDLGDGRTLDFIPVDEGDPEQRAFAFDVLYFDPAAGPFTITIRLTDKDGATTVERIVVEPEVRPAVESFVINGGQAQRSMLDGLTVVFAEPLPVDQDPGTFGLFQRAADGTFSIAIRGFEISNPSGDGRTWELTFPASAGFAADTLADGVYELQVAADTLRRFTFHRLFGDADGDGDVDFFDFLGLRSAYGSAEGDSAFRGEFDSNNDGRIDFFDFLALRANYGKGFDY